MKCIKNSVLMWVNELFNGPCNNSDMIKSFLPRPSCYRIKIDLKGIDWAKKQARKHWRNAIFCDEASFWLHGGRVKMWTKRGKKSLATGSKTQSEGSYLGGFSSMGTFSLCIFRENLTGSLYCKILEWHLLSQAEVFSARQWSKTYLKSCKEIYGRKYATKIARLAKSKPRS